MKTTDKIPLNETLQVSDGAGGVVTAQASRTVLEEIERLRSCGMLEAAQRLENSCDDTVIDDGRYVEIDPTSKGKTYDDRRIVFAEDKAAATSAKRK